MNSELEAAPVPSPSPQAPLLKITPIPIPSIAPALPKVRLSYGHLPYQEDVPNRLQLVGQFVRGGSARPEKMDLEAVKAFQEMSIAAKKAKVSLMPISGFRSIKDQTFLFARQTERQGSKTAAAKWSAPPGYSEHHTGYALDIADRQHPETDLKQSFADTPAYRWLVLNAKKFGFELSFPPHNWQGVSYEPWHWRFVGSERSSQIFAVAKQLAETHSSSNLPAPDKAKVVSRIFQK
ncbi:M15 family metallopeptidase [Leptolyngbya sp. AN03gr2]|uniref:M15 family metallopeptidase n=1 Tax=unclassified Leptolyngbya TaxID=2650499 RepID=UPI003D3194D5